MSLILANLNKQQALQLKSYLHHKQINQSRLNNSKKLSLVHSMKRKLR